MTTVDAPTDQSMQSDADLMCTDCGYNVRGLTEPRCPECGSTFDPGELRDHGRDHHRWLFEHGRPFLGTWRRTMWPSRFWRSVSPANPVHIRRLLLYWFVACLPLLALVATPLVKDAVAMNRDLARARALYRPVPGRPGLYAAMGRGMLTNDQIRALLPPLVSVGFVRRVFIFHLWHDDGPWLGPAAVAAAWPALSMATLLLFKPSLRRRLPDLLRVAVYSCDFALLLTAITLVTARFGRPMVNPFRTSPITDHAAEAILLATAVCAVVTTWRMAVACGRYLRLNRPIATVVAAQAMAILAACAMLVGAAKL